MAQQALPAGAPIRRRRALMGLVEADGWAWASIKAFAWFILIILLLGYLPDRAYYLTVNRTIDLGLLAWSPVNLCPAENKTLPCPAPVGAVIPWDQASPTFTPPAARVHASIAQLGTRLVLSGGTDGTSAQTTTWINELKDGKYLGWTDGPALPEPRTDASLVVIGSSAYLIGGTDKDGKAVNSIWVLPVDPKTSTLGTWAPLKDITLPEARTGAAAIAVSDGLVVAGGKDADGKVSAKVWKSTLDKNGALKPFEDGAALKLAVANASIAQVGDYVWLYGGVDDKGPVGAVQRGSVAVEPTPGQTPAPNATPAPTKVLGWNVSNSYNLPAARTAMAGFAANGALYVVGGNDGTGPKKEVYWTIPNGGGGIDAWHHLDQTDLPGGLEGAAPLVVGTNVYLFGGQTQDGVLQSGGTANLAPQEPFFQAGLVGVVVPALKIDGEIGQQLGYLNAAGVGTVDFVLLLLIGWAFAHKQQVMGWVNSRRNRRRGRVEG